MQTKTHTNRYGDKFTFTETEDGNILWEGSFKHCRFAWPNVYDSAYKAYCDDTEKPITLNKFKKAVHEYDKETYESTPLSKKYRSLVYSDTSIIDMVDPSGGPYLTSEMPANTLIPGMKGKITHFEPVETGYKILVG
jgi:C1A family cysteine protease